MGLPGYILIALLLLTNLVAGQVYDDDPIRHNNFETNPAYLANGKSTINANFVHGGSGWPSKSFYYDACRVSFYNRNYFTGLGVTLNNTHVSDSAAYRYIGIGGAYRIVMFNKVYTKIGLLYKAMSYRTSPGYFGYHSFSRINDGPVKNKWNDNLNVSLAFSSANDRFYISASLLNFQPWRTLDTNFSFPQYYVLNAGDLGKIMRLLSWEITYTTFAQKYAGGNILSMSQYLTILYSGFNLTRHSKIRYGARLGWADEKYIHVNPILSYYKSLDRRTSYFLCQLMLDLRYDPRKNKMPYQPNPQLSITYQF
jgi:hypothetical protein